jgi:hypothetical protein
MVCQIPLIQAADQQEYADFGPISAGFSGQSVVLDLRRQCVGYFVKDQLLTEVATLPTGGIINHSFSADTVEVGGKE